MNPCRYCVAPKRKAGCKATCPEYAEWLPIEKERKETIRKNKEKEKQVHTKSFVKNCAKRYRRK